MNDVSVVADRDAHQPLGDAHPQRCFGHLCFPVPRGVAHADDDLPDVGATGNAGAAAM